jgi:hypothetical protein
VAFSDADESKQWEISRMETKNAIRLFQRQMESGMHSEVNMNPFMATTAIEINPEPVAIEWHHGTIQELTDLITSHHLAFIESCCVISETKLTSGRLGGRYKQAAL